MPFITQSTMISKKVSNDKPILVNVAAFFPLFYWLKTQSVDSVGTNVSIQTIVMKLGNM